MTIYLIQKSIIKKCIEFIENRAFSSKINEKKSFINDFMMKKALFFLIHYF